MTPESQCRFSAGRASLSLWLLSISAAAAHFGICTILSSPFALDMDTVNLAFAIDRFDIGRLSPHPPGYLPYVLLLRGMQFVLQTDPLGTVQLASRLFSTATVLIMPFLVHSIRPDDTKAPFFAALLGALHPFLLFHGTDGQTHASEGFIAALLFLHLLKQSRRNAPAVGLLLALGASFRPSFILIGLGPVVWTFRKNKKALVYIALIAVVATVGWIVPTVVLTGGLERWRLAHEAFIVDGFMVHGAGWELIARRTLIWFALLIAPLSPGLLQTRQVPKGIPALTAAAALPAVVFFLFTFISEPGYLQGLVPLALAWTALLVARCRNPRTTLAIAFVIQIAVLALPEGGNIGIKTPSIPEIVNRQVESEVMLATLSRPLKETDRVLYITDYPGSAFQRQLPVLRPRTHVLCLYNFSSDASSHTALSFGTDRDLVPIPGPVMLADGPNTQWNTQSAYDFIVLSPFLSNDIRHRLREQIREQTACDIPDTTPHGAFVYLKTDCFPEGRLRLGKFRIVFRFEM